MGIPNTDLRNLQVAAFANALDRLSFLDDQDTALVTFTVAWETPSGGEANMTGLPLSADGLADGEAVAARLHSSTGPEEITGLTIAASGADFNMINSYIQQGYPVGVEGYLLKAATVFEQG